MVQQFEEPREPDSKLPIFSFAAKRVLFVLYIYIHPQREPALSLARRKPPGRGEWNSPRANFLQLPFLCAHADYWKRCGLVGVLVGGSYLGHTTPLCSLGLVSAQTWPALIHSFAKHRPKPHAMPKCLTAGRKRTQVTAVPLRSSEGRQTGKQCSPTEDMGWVRQDGEACRKSPGREPTGRPSQQRKLHGEESAKVWRTGMWLSWRGRWGRWSNGNGIGEATRPRSWGRKALWALGSPAEVWWHVPSGECWRGSPWQSRA